MRWTRWRKTNGASAYGQAVWSCPPDAGVNPRVEEPGETEANKPGTPGRSRSSRKTIAQGVPDVFRPYLSILCAFSFFAHKPAGAASARCSLRPRFSGDTDDASPGRKCAAGMRKCVLVIARSAATKQSISPLASLPPYGLLRRFRLRPAGYGGCAPRNDDGMAV